MALHFYRDTMKMDVPAQMSQFKANILNRP
jgi:hypothetical protein